MTMSLNIRARRMRVSMEPLERAARQFASAREITKARCPCVAKSLPLRRTHIFSETHRAKHGERDFERGVRGLEGSLQEAASERGWTGLTEQVRQYNAKRPTRVSEDEGYTRPRSIRVHRVSCILMDVCRCLRACASKADATVHMHTRSYGRASEIAAQPPAALATCFLSPSRVYFDLLCRR